jgi:hypothetical protein
MQLHSNNTACSGQVGFCPATPSACYGQKAIHFSVDITGGKTLADILFNQATKAKQTS